MKVGYFNLAVAVFILGVGSLMYHDGHPAWAALDLALAALNIFVGYKNLKRC